MNRKPWRTHCRVEVFEFVLLDPFLSQQVPLPELYTCVSAHQALHLSEKVQIEDIESVALEDEFDLESQILSDRIPESCVPVEMLQLQCRFLFP